MSVVTVERQTSGLPLTPEQIFREYGARVYSLARRLLGSDADADDVTQDVFVQVLRKLSSFRGDAALPTWLHRVTVNASLTYRRKRAAYRKHCGADLRDGSVENSTDRASVRCCPAQPDELALESERYRLVGEAVARLPRVYRDVCLLADIEELTNAQIAGVLGLSAAAVKSRLHRGRLLMRKALAPHFEEAA